MPFSVPQRDSSIQKCNVRNTDNTMTVDVVMGGNEVDREIAKNPRSVWKGGFQLK
jgi:hypothetical protein